MEDGLTDITLKFIDNIEIYDAYHTVLGLLVLSIADYKNIKFKTFDLKN